MRGHRPFFQVRAVSVKCSKSLHRLFVQRVTSRVQRSASGTPPERTGGVKLNVSQMTYTLMLLIREFAELHLAVTMALLLLLLLQLLKSKRIGRHKLLTDIIVGKPALLAE